MTRAVCTLGLAIAVLVAPLSAARADEPAASAAAHDDAARAHARSRYLEGVAFVQKAQWSDALAAFEESARVFPNPTTTLDIGACERALGRYVRARATLQRALDESAASASPLPESSAADAKAFLGEIDRLLVTAAVHVEPVDAAIAIDGRPLAPSTRDGKPVLAAGVLPPGPGAPPPSADFVVVLDPGVHVITLSRKGFAEAVVNRSFAPGVRSTLDLKLDRLPAT
ncbi:MAG TPA: PEGA domain-containing protein, partial [Minicystis sp.]|nr:PEGA domain-containing protein [Minicystis sp.]